MQARSSSSSSASTTRHNSASRRASAVRQPRSSRRHAAPRGGAPARSRSATAQRVNAFTTSTSSPTTTAKQSTASSAATALSAAKQRLVLSWAGAGIYYFWQLGAMKYLQEHFDMRKVQMVGASAGSLLSVLAACGVPADRVIDRAYQLSVEHNIWERPLGLVGIWGSLIEQWLDELLPDNAHEICRGRVTVIVTTLPDMAQVGISDFESKQDLINACMASSHVPMLLDLKPTRPCRGRQCVDGSFPDFFTGLNCELLRYGPQADPNREAVVFDYFDDSALNRSGRFDMLQVKSYQEIRRMYRVGYEYAARLHSGGRFDHYELSELLLQGARGHMSEVLVPEGSSHAGTGGAAGKQPAPAFASTTSTTHGNSSSNGSGVAVLAAAAALGSGGSGEAVPPPMGLVLELEQDEAELMAEVSKPTPRPARRVQGQQRAPQQQYSAA